MHGRVLLKGIVTTNKTIAAFRETTKFLTPASLKRPKTPRMDDSHSLRPNYSLWVSGSWREPFIGNHSVIWYYHHEEQVCGQSTELKCRHCKPILFFSYCIPKF